MPNKLSDEKRRISYAERVEVVRALKKRAAKEGVTVTDLIKQAVEQYLAEQDGEPSRRPKR